MEKIIKTSLFIDQRPTLSLSLQHSLKILAMNNLELQEYQNEKIRENPFLTEKFHGADNCYDQMLEIPDKNNFLSEIFREVSFFNFSDREKEITATLVNSIDDNEYLKGEMINRISKENNVSYSDLLKIIHKLQNTSFSSMFSFNLQDKIKIFLAERCANFDPYRLKKYETLISNMDLVFSKGWSILKLRYGFGDDELAEMISVIRKVLLSNFNRDNSVSYPSIDLLIERESPREFAARIESSTLSDISFDDDLYRKSIEKCRAKSDKEYIKNNAADAKLLVKFINNRSITLLKIANEIAYRQRSFLTGADLSLSSVSIKSIACSLSLHESTISRAISNKTVSTPRGIFEMKSLLPRKIEADNDNVITDYSIKEYIKELVRNEPKSNPYSDGKIMSFLNSNGISISRRTVAKYRDALDIPNVVERVKIYKRVANI